LVVVQSIDSYMNVQLSNTEEFINQKPTGTLGQVLIRYGNPFFLLHASLLGWRGALMAWNRCNNVLWITAADKGENGDTKMEG
jgi:small nuclear ribonucleoprotein F